MLATSAMVIAAASVPTTAVARVAALAGSADLAVQISGNVVNKSGHKATVITVTNHGPGTASGIILDLSETRVDSEAIDGGSVNFCETLPGTMPPYERPSPDPEFPNRGYDIPVAGECALDDLSAGRSIRLETRVRMWSSAGPRVGDIRAVVSHDGTDPMPENDSAAVPLITVRDTTDVYVRVWDVPYQPDGGSGAVVPGQTATLRYEVGNPGTGPVTGITVTLRLPENVVFEAGGCRYTAGRMEATCAYPDLRLVPKVAETERVDDAPAAVIVTHRVRVLAKAPAPAVLAGGSVEVSLTGATASDVDSSDNRDRLTVFTRLAGGGDEGLPVTGPSARMLAGLGSAAVLAGAVMVVLAARRRSAPPGAGPRHSGPPAGCGPAPEDRAEGWQSNPA